MMTKGEQFAPIPIRVVGDTRLSANDLRVLSVIAYHDRFGRNGIGCTVDPRKLADLVKIDRSHWSRHTNRLEKLGYLEITASPTDRRKKHYSVVYSEQGTDDSIGQPQASTSEAAGGMEAGCFNVHDGGDRPGRRENEFAMSGGDDPEKVANTHHQSAENKRDSSCHKKSRKTESKRSREAAFVDFARSPVARNCHPMARQKEQYLEQCGVGRGFDMEVVIGLLAPMMSRDKASEFIMEAMDMAQNHGLTAEHAGDAVAKAVKGWQAKGFPPKRFPELLRWAVGKCQRR